MSNFLVTGGAGFVGSAIAKKLIATNHNVWIIDNLSTGFKENVPDQTVFIEGDCSKVSTIAKLRDQKFDAIFHIAGQSSGEISFEDPIYDIQCNTLSTLQLLKYAVKTGCRKIIYASTMSVYGDHEKQKVSELDETNPKSFYAVGKLASERYLQLFKQNYDIDFVALRYFNIYGPGQNMENMKQGMVSIYLKQIIDSFYNEVTVKGSLERFRDFIYIDDVVNISINALDNDKMNNLILNVGTGVKTTINQLIERLMTETSIKKKIQIVEGTPGDQFGIFAHTGLLFSCLDYKFQTFENGIRLFVNSLMRQDG
jgi:UDP-glucose 4-epimerase